MQLGRRQGQRKGVHGGAGGWVCRGGCRSYWISNGPSNGDGRRPSPVLPCNGSMGLYIGPCVSRLDVLGYQVGLIKATGTPWAAGGQAFGSDKT